MLPTFARATRARICATLTLSGNRVLWGRPRYFSGSLSKLFGKYSFAIASFRLSANYSFLGTFCVVSSLRGPYRVSRCPFSLSQGISAGFDILEIYIAIYLDIAAASTFAAPYSSSRWTFSAVVFDSATIFRIAAL